VSTQFFLDPSCLPPSKQAERQQQDFVFSLNLDFSSPPSLIDRTCFQRVQNLAFRHPSEKISFQPFTKISLYSRKPRCFHLFHPSHYRFVTRRTQHTTTQCRPLLISTPLSLPPLPGRTPGPAIMLAIQQQPVVGFRSAGIGELCSDASITLSIYNPRRLVHVFDIRRVTAVCNICSPPYHNVLITSTCVGVMLIRC
jgi:hypothetical protein